MHYIEKRRVFNWVSSSDVKNSNLLNQLDRNMFAFYSGWESRNQYQQMLDCKDCDDPGLATLNFLEYIKTIEKKSFLEIGCGSGSIYQSLIKDIKNFEYTGIEVSDEIIKKNQAKFPAATWIVADAYNIPLLPESVDVCFSFYVLEHLVYPEKAITAMLNVIKRDGYLILVFPDFAASGRFASQFIGLSNETTALRKLKKGRVLDALISLYDSRIRLPKALKNANKIVGEFPVNLSPKCLTVPDILMSPDIDAVYIASKNEIENWCLQRGYKSSYPAGKDGYFSEHTFIAIRKNAET